jgi:glycosyltransferase involved in cell wall biosynthesis
MAELIEDGVNGLHAPAGDAAGLAAVMRRGIEEVGLWERLQINIHMPKNMVKVAEEHFNLYRELQAA